MSRIKKVTGNFITACVTDLTTQILKFIVRTVFIHTLGEDYLGINGLFTNILSMLSLAELGIGAAINYNLYKSLFDNNNVRTSQLMKFYKLAYFIIGCVIFVVGLIIIPVLPLIIKDYYKISGMGINAVFLYILYLFQTVSSYWFLAYKSAIIRADQKEYIINNVHTISIIITSILQIICLYTFSSLISYTIVIIIVTIGQNLVIALLAKHMYPKIKENKTASLSRTEIVSMLKDCGAVFIYKLNSVVVNATDNMVLSSVIGLWIVGLYSNYLMAVYLIRSLSGKFYNAITASFGNLHVEGNKEYEYKIFKVINYCTFIMFSVASVWMFCNVHDFIDTWVGQKYVVKTFEAGGKVINIHLNVLLAVEMYCFGMYSFLSRIRNSTGIFRDVMISPIISMILNLIVSLVLTPYYGIAGVVLGTIVSGVCTYMWIDPIIIHKKVFNRSAINYFLKNLIYIICTVLAGFLSYLVLQHITLGGWFGLILRSIIAVMITLAIDTALLFRCEELKYLSGVFVRVVKGIRMHKYNNDGRIEGK